MVYFCRKADELIEGVSNTLDKIRKDGKKIFFVTNNSAKSRAGYLKKFHSLGLNVSEEGRIDCCISIQFPCVFIAFFGFIHRNSVV